jgi:hypothetical protein
MRRQDTMIKMVDRAVLQKFREAAARMREDRAAGSDGQCNTI